MESSQLLATVEAMHADARRRGLYFQTCTDRALSGRTITLRGRQVVSFSSCSYLGLELHPAVMDGVREAVERYGAQFSCSRGYVSAPLYDELDTNLEQIFGAPVLVTPSTTMAHLIALPVLATERDAIVLDHQAHHSVHMGANQARAGGAVIEIVRHDQLERACEVVRRLAQRHRTVWFASDGVFSMYGDLAPIHALSEILAVAPNVRLYIDDAHGMSWAGRHGRGSFLSRFPMNDRLVLATSFAKGFGAGGGCLVFSDPAERERVRLSGGPLVFSGPMQPPMMGAVVASSRVHLSPEITELQHALATRAAHTNRRLVASGIAPIVLTDSPIFFLLCGLPRVAFQVAERLLDDGVYVSCSVFPTVPMRRAGIRFTITTAHRIAEIDHAIARLAVHLPAVLAEEGVSEQALGAMFLQAVPNESRKVPAAPLGLERAGEAPNLSPLSSLGALVSWGEAGSLQVSPPRVMPRTSPRVLGRAPSAPTVAPGPSRPDRPRLPDLAPGALRLERADRIEDIDRDDWNAVLGDRAHCSWEALRTAERVYGDPAAAPEHRWRFRYLLVRNEDGVIVAATFLTTLLQKDDMLSSEQVSREVELRRRSDPYFLTSTVVQLGSNLSEGDHLYLDRRGPWREALRRILAEAGDEVDRSGASALIVRDLPDGDAELDTFMLGEGLSRVPIFDRHRLDLRPGLEEWHAGLPKKKRQQLRAVIAAQDTFTTSIHGYGRPALAPTEVAQLHALYRQLAARKLRLNVFPLPDTLLPALLQCPAWEVGVLRLRPEAGGPDAPIAFWAAHHAGGHYAPLFCGLDDAWLASHETYRAMLWKILLRARELGATTLDLGMDAEIEKRRFGAETVRTCIYVQAQDHYAGALLREIVAEVAVPRAPGSLAALDTARAAG